MLVAFLAASAALLPAAPAAAQGSASPAAGQPPASAGPVTSTSSAAASPDYPLPTDGSSAAAALDLSGPAGPRWVVSNANGSIAGLPISVPGYPLAALREVGLLGAPAEDPRSDPLYRFNELEFRWVAMDTWTLAANFTTPRPPPAAAPPSRQGAAGAAAGGSGAGGDSDDSGAGCGWDLVLEGVDTVADVALNGRLLARLKNFHRTHRLDVRDSLLAPGSGTNTLAITLHPAVPYVRQQAASYPYPVPSNTAVGAFGQFAFVRKPASDLGWDWGPAFAPAGVAGPVRLVWYCRPFLAGLHVLEQIHGSKRDPKAGEGAGGFITLRLEAEVWIPTPPPPSPDAATGAAAAATPPHVVVVELRDPANGGGGDGAALARAERPVGQPAATEDRRTFLELQMDVPASAVQLWWPVGFGAQPLYTLAAWLELQRQPPGAATEAAGAAAPGAGGQGEGEATGGQQTGPGGDGRGDGGGGGGGDLQWRPLSGVSSRRAVRRRIGFRTLELVTAPMAEAVEELAGGSGGDNVTPGVFNTSAGKRPFPAPPPESFYLRVNGRPVFARGANLIPLAVLHTDPWVAGPQGLARLLAAALGAGMNMLRIWGGGRYQLEALYDMADGAGLLLWQEFMFACNPYPNTLEFLEEVRLEAAEQVRRLAGHPSVAVWGGNNEVEVSFTWFNETINNTALYAADFTALFVEALGGVAGNDILAGDVHYYNYQDDCLDPAIYPRARFVSEYGYQSFTSYQAVLPYSEAADRTPLSPFMLHRQRHPKGEQELIASLASHFLAPPGGWNRTAPAAAGIRLAQAPSARASAAAAATGSGARASSSLSVARRRSVAERAAGPAGGGVGGAKGGGSGSQLLRRASRVQVTPRPRIQGDPDLFVPWIYQQQVQQALCYTTALATWRSLRSDPRVGTMGVLYWQLNDIWPAYSWSSLDYLDPRVTSSRQPPTHGSSSSAAAAAARDDSGSDFNSSANATAAAGGGELIGGGGWKPLHSAVRRLFSPLALVAAPLQPGGNVTAHVVNDGPRAVPVRFSVLVVSLAENMPACNGGGGGAGCRVRVVQASSRTLSAPPQRSTPLLLSAPASPLLEALPGCSKTTCVLLLRLHALAGAGSAAARRSGDGDGGGEGGEAGEAGAGGDDGGSWPWGLGDPAADEAALLRMASWRELTPPPPPPAERLPPVSQRQGSEEMTTGAPAGGGSGAASASTAKSHGSLVVVPVFGGGIAGAAPSSVAGPGERRSVATGLSQPSPGPGGDDPGTAAGASAASRAKASSEQQQQQQQPDGQGWGQARADGAMASSGGGSGAGLGGAWDWGTSEALVLLAPPKDLQLHLPDIELYNISVRPVSSYRPDGSGAAPSHNSGGTVTASAARSAWCFRLRARRAAALLVALESSLRGAFDENLILLLPPPASPPPPAAPTMGSATTADESAREAPSWQNAFGGGAPLCFYTSEDVAGGEGGFRAALSVRDLHGMQAF
ncbi:hypothetical protein GPECTOR_29g104 [Gonium pectorale]|uniref:beta-mannosidase n=1 Tax=Gonium pectorale TaxID=33097 RepID=A0A150GEB8_GONPE|nr:hypothetical protein GPECTOR_29g104 [Gonium pectorale]|eukprot:KXZ48197.1 hypothetical protein GPECTOR_29g104 [Gonium pectorale]